MPKDTADLFEVAANQEKKKKVFSVTEITQGIKLILENTFGQVWVEGEISNFRPAASGHFYFSLKDENALLAAAMFSRANKDIKFKIEDGLKVICFGKIEVYGPRSQYQIIIERLEPKGIGGLQLALEQLKERLEKEGLFSAEHKKPIPYLPGNIGVVTSGYGAAIKDILKVLDKRFKDTHIIINPVRVQGEGAKEEIAQAIIDFNSFNQQVSQNERIEVMIVGRGGGSIEDLWAFNEEIVARAIYNSRIPVISAVGHERDWTISDLVADLRAATPSVAAEQVIPKKEDLDSKLGDLIQDLKRSFLDMALNLDEEIDGLAHRLRLNMLHLWEINNNEFASTVKKLSLLNPAALIPQFKDKIINLAKQIYVRAGHFIKLKESVLVKSVEKISNLNPLNILSRGYSVTFKMPNEEIIKDASLVKIGGIIKTRLHKGELVSEIKEIK